MQLAASIRMPSHKPGVQDCEEVVRVNGTLPRDMLPLDRTAVQLRRAVTQELAEAGVQGVAGTWGGDWHTPPLPPQYALLAASSWLQLARRFCLQHKHKYRYKQC